MRTENSDYMLYGRLGKRVRVRGTLRSIKEGITLFRVADLQLFPFHHRSPYSDILDLHGIDCKRVVVKDGEVGKLARLDAAPFVFKTMGVSRVEGYSPQCALARGPLFLSRDTPRTRDPIDRTPHEKQRVSGRHWHVGME